MMITKNNEDSKKLRILLFKTGAIGDTLMTTPLVRQLRKNFPLAKIDYLIGNVAAQVLEGNRNIDEIIKFNPDIFFKKKVIEYTRLIKSIKKTKYDVIFVLDKHIIFNLTARLSSIPKRIGFDRLGKEGKFLTDRIHYGNDKHEIYYYLDLLKGMTKDGKEIEPDYDDNSTDLPLKDKDLEFAREFFKEHGFTESDTIAIAPGGGKNPGEKTEYRNWPVEKYSELAKNILDKYKKYNIILIGGKDDAEKADTIMEHISDAEDKKRIVSLVAKCSLHESAAVIHACRCFICNDTGTMHIGGAVNHHVISVFGPTRPDRKAPLWKESRSVWKDEEIYEKDYELYGRKSKDKDKKFMEKITPEDVIRCI